eukprot:6192874-Pleurochrysis_carterae.AAC.1
MKLLEEVSTNGGQPQLLAIAFSATECRLLACVLRSRCSHSSKIKVTAPMGLANGPRYWYCRTCIARIFRAI